MSNSMSGGGRRAVWASAGTGKAQLFLETGKRYPSTSDIHCVKLGDDQGIMRKIQARCVSWFVNLLGIRWSSSH
jgi:hypothetical protein